IIVILLVLGSTIVFMGLMTGTIIVALVMIIFESLPVVGTTIAILAFIAALAGAYWLFCLIASRFAYIPQAMLVEEAGILAAFGRSFSLASGNVKRFAALLGFTVVATYSALAVLYIPLMWYAWGTGVDLFGSGISPAWYEVASQ